MNETVETGITSFERGGDMGVMIWLIALLVFPCLGLMAWLVRYVVKRFDGMNDKVVGAMDGMTGAVTELTAHIKSDDRSVKAAVNEQWSTLNDIREDIAVLKDRRRGKRTSAEDRRTEGAEL